MINKICQKCNKEKSLFEFHRHKRHKDGYRNICKDCRKLESRICYLLNKNNPWVLTYIRIKQRCMNPKNCSYPRYGGRGIKCLITANELKFLWFRDKAYEMKKPSIDRIDNDGNYILENCRYIELSENFNRMNNKRKKKVLQYTKHNKLIKEYESIEEASRQTKVATASITAICNYKRKTAGGFIWRFKNEI